MLKLNDNNVSSMVAAKCFAENTEKINSIDYNGDGTLMVTSSNDDSITVFDCTHGTKTRSVSFQVDVGAFTFKFR